LLHHCYCNIIIDINARKINIIASIAIVNVSINVVGVIVITAIAASTLFGVHFAPLKLLHHYYCNIIIDISASKLNILVSIAIINVNINIAAIVAITAIAAVHCSSPPSLISL
jgi:hypothetical protein